MIRIGFFGTPALARSVLSDIVDDARFEVAFVVTNPDAPFGRDQTLQPSPVKSYALEQGTPVFTPRKIRGNTEFLDTLRTYLCDYFVVVAYGKILPKELLEIPKKMSVNIHGSLLPKYRGASPIQSVLLAGEEETGVTIMQMSEGMDEWDLLFIEKIPIAPDETSSTLFAKFANISGKTLTHTLFAFEQGKIVPTPQDSTEATYCKKIEKEHGKIDWSKSAKEIYHMWQAYTPWPGIYTFFWGKRLLLEQVWFSPNDRAVQKPGTVVRLQEGNLWVVCGEWVLTLTQVKLEWKKSQSTEDFIRGNQHFLWTSL